MTPRPARVLFVDPVGEKGGAEVVLLDLVRGLDRARFEPIVACLRPGPFVEELRALAVPAFDFPPHRARQPHRVALTVARLTRLAQRERVDILHVNTGHLLAYGTFASRLAGRPPVVWHVHDPLVGTGTFERVFRTVQKRMQPAATIFANPSVARSYLAAYPRIGLHRTVLPGVDTARPPGDPAAARTALGIPEGAPIVTMMARLQEHKGQLHLVEVAGKLRETHPDTRYVICGAPLFGQGTAYEARVQRRVAELRLADRVHLTGFVSEQMKRDVLAAAAVLAHPADVEPFGVTVIEGMAAAVPIVASDAEGPALSVVHGETGLLFPKGDTDALAAALDKLLSDPSLAADMGAAGRRRVDARFSIRAAMSAVEELYDEVLAARGARRGRGRAIRGAP